MKAEESGRPTVAGIGHGDIVVLSVALFALVLPTLARSDGDFCDDAIRCVNYETGGPFEVPGTEWSRSDGSPVTVLEVGDVSGIDVGNGVLFETDRSFERLIDDESSLELHLLLKDTRPFLSATVDIGASMTTDDGFSRKIMAARYLRTIGVTTGLQLSRIYMVPGCRLLPFETPCFASVSPASISLVSRLTATQSATTVNGRGPQRPELISRQRPGLQNQRYSMNISADGGTAPGLLVTAFKIVDTSPKPSAVDVVPDPGVFDIADPIVLDPPTVPEEYLGASGRAIVLAHGFASSGGGWPLDMATSICERIGGVVEVSAVLASSMTRVCGTPDGDDSVYVIDWSSEAAAFAKRARDALAATGAGSLNDALDAMPTDTRVATVRLPWEARSRADSIGAEYARDLARSRHSSFHLLGHSAGAALIDAMARSLRREGTLALGGSALPIHQTFFDAFDGSLNLVNLRRPPWAAAINYTDTDFRFHRSRYGSHGTSVDNYIDRRQALGVTGSSVNWRDITGGGALDESDEWVSTRLALYSLYAGLSTHPAVIATSLAASSLESTRGLIAGAYNVDVTDADSERPIGFAGYLRGHSWPYLLYQETVDGTKTGMFDWSGEALGDMTDLRLLKDDLDSGSFVFLDCVIDSSEGSSDCRNDAAVLLGPSAIIDAASGARQLAANSVELVREVSVAAGETITAVASNVYDRTTGAGTSLFEGFVEFFDYATSPKFVIDLNRAGGSSSPSFQRRSVDAVGLASSEPGQGYYTTHDIELELSDVSTHLSFSALLESAPKTALSVYLDDVLVGTFKSRAVTGEAIDIGPLELPLGRTPSEPLSLVLRLDVGDGDVPRLTIADLSVIERYTDEGFLLESGEWVQVSVPDAHLRRGRFVDVFSGLLEAGSFGEQWIAFAYDATAREYVELGPDTPVRDLPGGFWLIQETGEPVPLALPEAFGTEASDASCGGRRCRSTTIVPEPSARPMSWAMVGSPFSVGVPSDGLGLRDESRCATACSIDEAIAAELVGPELFHYEPSERRYVPSQLDSADLDPWVGYWMAVTDQLSGSVTLDYVAGRP